jgi:membrane protease subunit HflK
MYIETMQQILSSTSKVMIDTKNGTNQVYLPLDRLLAQSTANEAARGAGSGPMMVPPQNPAQPAQPGQQPQAQSQQPQSSTATQPDNASGESARTRELRSRDTGRERESR